MKDTFTTIVTPTKDGIEIMTQHDQTGSASVNGFVPTENIPILIEKLKKLIGFNLPVMQSDCVHSYKAIYLGMGYVAQCTKCGVIKK